MVRLEIRAKPWEEITLKITIRNVAGNIIVSVERERDLSQLRQKVKLTILARGEKGITRTELYRSLGSGRRWSSEDLNTVLRELVENGEIAEKRIGRKKIYSVKV